MLTELQKHLEETNLLPKSSKLLLAVSGGVDSITLLHLLHNLRQYYDWDITVAHYNHGVRSDAMLDAALVGELADTYGYPYLLGKYEGTNASEAAMRKARYEYLEQMRRDVGADYVVTAHHGNDRMETALFNTIRGADREGIVALKDRRGNIIRPLLPFMKPEIIVFANLQKLPYREDKTNADLNYSRNFVRNVLVPHGSLTFRNFHHNFNRRLAKLEVINRRIRAGLDRLEGQLVVVSSDQTIEMKKKAFIALPQEIKQAFLVRLIKQLAPAFQFSRKTIQDSLKFIETTKAGDRHPLPSGLHLINSYDTVIITSDPQFVFSPENSVFHALSPTKPFRNTHFVVSLKKASQPQHNSLRAPQEKLYIRHRQPGDRVYPVGMDGSKKLQDVFVDAKIPRHLRDSWPLVVTAKNNIVWVPQLVTDRRVSFQKKDSHYLICEVL